MLIVNFITPRPRSSVCIPPADFHLLSLLKDAVGWNSSPKHIFHQSEAALCWALRFWLSPLPQEELRKRHLEQTSRSHVISIWKTLTSRSREPQDLSWKCSTRFKGLWINTCPSTNVAPIHKTWERGRKGAYSPDNTAPQHVPWKMMCFLNSNRNTIRWWVTIKTANTEYITFCSHTRHPQRPNPFS